jgi:hypothetical protein
MSAFDSAIEAIRANRRAYLAINVGYYGLVFLGMLVAGFFPSVQHVLLDRVRFALATGFLSPVTEAYRSGNFVSAAVLTFLVNSLLGAMAAITLPSVPLPFAGCLLAFYRAAMWGLTLSPTSPAMLLAMAPHSITLLFEGQAYVLAAFGCYLWGKWFLLPRQSGFATRRRAYAAGFRASVQLYTMILPVLAISAVYEAAEVIIMARLVRHLAGA